MAKPVVIYQHGFVDSCAGIICAGEDSLGLRLVNAGFDLWLANSRGNRYSKNHMNSDDELFARGFPDEHAAYWAFSFDQMAEYD